MDKLSFLIAAIERAKGEVVEAREAENFLIANQPHNTTAIRFLDSAIYAQQRFIAGMFEEIIEELSPLSEGDAQTVERLLEEFHQLF